MRGRMAGGRLQRIFLVAVLLGLLASAITLTVTRAAQARRAVDERSRIVRIDEATTRLDSQVVMAREELAGLKAEYDRRAADVSAQVAQIDRLQAQAASLTGKS